VVNTVSLDRRYGEATRICFDSRDRKLYVGTDNDNLLVFNWSCDSLVARFGVWPGVDALAYYPLGNRVYCGNRYGFVEVYCATDEVARHSELRGGVSQICFRDDGTRVYCIGGDSLLTIDCGTARVVGIASVPGRASALCYNPTDDKVYCGGTSDSVSVHAGSDGRLLATLATGPIPGSGSFAYDSRSNTVLCASAERHSITSIDGESDRVLRTLTIPETPLSVVAAGAHPFSFAPCNGSLVAVIRMDTVPAGLGVAAAPGRTSGSLVRGRLFSTAKPGSVLMNAAGRKVLDLHPGMNDVGSLPSGIYFVREQSAVRKVVITR
jgi:DNA-binding beta-propeller fold protein YncE